MTRRDHDTSSDGHERDQAEHYTSDNAFDIPPRDNPDNYVLRVFYYNPEDPALMVPMRYGSGIDFNYGRWAGKTLVLLLCLGLVCVLITIL